MRNLKVISSVNESISNLSGCDCVVSGDPIIKDKCMLQRKFYVFYDNAIYLLSINNGILATYNVSPLFPEKVPKVQEMIYVDFCNLLYTFHKDGTVLAFKNESDSSNIIGGFFTNIEGEIETIQCSPDKEIGVCVTNDNVLKVFVMTPVTFDIICQYNMLDSSQGNQELVNVGWGKKETQFHGLEGKNAAISSKADTSYLNDKCSKSVHITWRGDSTMFAVGYWCLNSNKRRVKIFSRDGFLHCINEDMTGIDGPLSWRPQGNLIALSQHLPNKYVMAFLEKNGLRHLDFEIPPGYTVKHICWNADSIILCLLVEQIESNKSYIMLWTSRNYHWYLKQMYQLNFDVCKIFWDEERENKLYIISKCGKFIDIEFSWDIDHSNYSSTSNKYFVSVIDNEKVLLTPFHAAIIPPPMCKWSLQCPGPINKILYPITNGVDDSEYFMCAILHDGKFCFFSENCGEPLLTRIDDSITYELTSESSLYHWIWVNNKTLVCVSTFSKNVSTIMNVHVEEDKLVIMKKTSISHPVIALSADSINVWMYLIDGRRISYNIEDNSLSGITEFFPQSCYNVVTHSTDVYGLSDWNRLYKNGTEIASNIVSFLVQESFVLATTANHTLLILKHEGSEVEEISLRKLERGSKLIAVTGNTVIMQLPRGNLETIQPRALTVMSAGKLIDSKLYKETIHLLRRQRIAFDLCIDHNPSEFFANIDNFVQKVDPQWITLLVTELVPADVTRGIYSPYYPKERTNYYLEHNKIIRICDSLLQALLNINNNEKYMMPILSCLVKSKNIPKAIEMVNSDQGLQHLLFLVDVDTLYNEALGAYNLEAALKIAGKSQMDPKEYIPFLNALKEMDNDYMKYEIDKMLKRDESALRNLSKCGDDKLELMFALIEEGRLYNLALEVFENQLERYYRAANLYGEYLYKQGSFEESGIMFIRSTDLKKAIQAFTKSGNWRNCLLLAKRCSYSECEIKKLGDALCCTLINLKKYNEAALMYKEYFSDVNKALDIFLKGHLFHEAIYLAANSGQDQLIDTTIKKSVLDATDALFEEIESIKTKIINYTTRLKQVRVEKLNKPKFKDFDEMSDAGSVTSRSNQSYATRSSKMTKKMSRKMWSLKEGNPREEEALVATISQMMVNSQKIIEDVKIVSVITLHLNCDKKGKLLQDLTKELLQVIEKGKNDVWPKDPNEEETVFLDAKFKHPPDLIVDSRWQLSIYNGK